MHRKQFLIYATTATGLLPLLLTEVACDTYGDSGAGDGGETGDDLSFTLGSSINSGHTHTVSILFADVNDPPAGGKTLSTSRTSGYNGHAHHLTLTQSDLQALKDGQTLTRTTSSDAPHTHTFTISVPETASGNGNGNDNPYYGA